MKPNVQKGARICMAVTQDGVTVYGNKIGLESLSEWLAWIAKNNPSENYECHTKMYLMDDDCVFEGKKPNNIWVLKSKDVAHSFYEENETCPGFELTFMGVTEKDLDEMAQHQKTGILPDEWIHDAAN
jgi:hypothetical protein